MSVWAVIMEKIESLEMDAHRVTYVTGLSYRRKKLGGSKSSRHIR